MPAYCTHYIFACEMADKFDIKKDIKLNSDAVLIGTQGPDIFFFHRLLSAQKSLRHLGSTLHRTKSGLLLDALSKYCNKTQNKDIAYSYAYGFIMHLALDSTCHPYVYALEDKMISLGSKMHPGAIHNTIEMNMDSLMLYEHLDVKKPSCFNTAITVPTEENVLYEVSREIAFMVNETTDYKITSNDAKQAILDTKEMQKMFHDENGKKKKIISVLENVASPFTKNFKITSMLRPNDLEKAKKYGNISNGSWTSPFEKGKRNESFFDLYELSKQYASQMINGFNLICDGELTGYDVTHNKSFLTGVEIK